MLKNSLILLAASLPILSHAEEMVYALTPPAPVGSCELPVGYFWPAQLNLGECGWDISVAGEFIYWEVNRDSECDLGTKNTVQDGGLTVVAQTLVHHQGYRPGFKVAVGMGFPRFDNWSANVEYTWFHHKSTNNFNADGGAIVARNFLQVLDPPLFAASPAGSLRSQLQFNFDFLTATVGRSFYLSQRFVTDLGVGLKSWWSSLHSDLRFNLLNGLTGTQHTKSGLWGIGPYVKAEVKGLLWCGTYVYTKAAVWSPYTRFNQFRSETNFPAATNQFGQVIPAVSNVEKNRTFYYTTQLFYEGGAGLGWGTYFCNCSYHMDVVIGYEMMTTYVRGYAFVMGSPHREFYFQGLTVKAQLDF